MSKMIQLRNVPDALHRRLKARAASAGLSLSDYLVEEIRRVAESPTLEELWDRVRRRAPVEHPVDAAAWIREERAER